MNNENKNKLIPIYNPLLKDFSVNYAFNDEAPKEYTIHAREIESFPEYIALHIAKHLAQKVVWERGIKTSYDDEFDKAYKEITVIDLKI